MVIIMNFKRICIIFLIFTILLSLPVAFAEGNGTDGMVDSGSDTVSDSGSVSDSDAVSDSVSDGSDSNGNNADEFTDAFIKSVNGYFDDYTFFEGKDKYNGTDDIIGSIYDYVKNYVTYLNESDSAYEFIDHVLDVWDQFYFNMINFAFYLPDKFYVEDYINVLTNKHDEPFIDIGTFVDYH